MVVSRFFVIKNTQFSEETDDQGNKTGAKTPVLVSDDGQTELAQFLTWSQIGSFEHENQNYLVIRAVLDPSYISAMAQAAGPDGEALSMQTVENLGIAGSYCGAEYSDRPFWGVCWFIQQRFGLDLSGEYEAGTDENGQPVMVTYLRRVTMAGES